MAQNIVLVSSDKKGFVVPQDIFKQSETLKLMYEDLPPESLEEVLTVPIENADSASLSKVILYMELLASGTSNDPLISSNFLQSLGPIGSDLYVNVMNLANYLDVVYLVDLCAQGFADAINALTPEQIREVFGTVKVSSPKKISPTKSLVSSSSKSRSPSRSPSSSPLRIRP